MAQMTTPIPARKVVGSALGGAVATILIWFIESVMGGALDDAVQLAVVTLTTFVVGYYTPPAARDTLRDEIDPAVMP